MFPFGSHLYLLLGKSIYPSLYSSYIPPYMIPPSLPQWVHLSIHVSVGNKFSPCCPAAWRPRPAERTHGSLSTTPGDGRRAQSGEEMQNGKEKQEKRVRQDRWEGLELKKGGRGDEWIEGERQKIHLLFTGCSSCSLHLLPPDLHPSSLLLHLYPSVFFQLTEHTYNYPQI